MSETVRNDVSIESICTVIENTPEKVTKNNCKIQFLTNGDSHKGAHIINNDINNDLTNVDSSENENSIRSSISEYSLKENGNGETSTDINCDSTVESNKSDQDSSNLKYRKIKKSVSFDPNDEKVRKFISGDPIVDQKNPFKSNGVNGNLLNGISAYKNNKKKTPPPVPTKRSTLSVRKTVTQQLREREREKEKEKERIKNETNNRKSNLSNGGATLVSPEDFITTEEVLKQSKYVKTYIKNPDPFFVYDPTILARLKLEELRELSEKKTTKKLKLTNLTKERLKDIKKKSPLAPINSSKLPFKKCSKPNYPELSDIKVKTGTDSDGEFFNPAEVTKNAKKFDERVKKLHIGLEDDLDDIEGPLTKSESSDEVPLTSQNSDDSESNSNNDKTEISISTTDGMNTGTVETQPIKGTFTNTIKSKEFKDYLEKKGLTIMPKKIPNGAQSIYGNGIGHNSSKSQCHISFKAPESVQISIDTMDSPQNQSKKPSVFQRLLGNSIFASRRRTTPKEAQHNPRTLNDFNAKCKENGVGHNASPLKRVVLERQSYHGRSKASNLLSPAEALDLKAQMERSRRSYTSGGDDISVSISSALTNAEYSDATDAKHYTNNNNGMPILRKNDTQTKPLAKPPRRTLSRDRLSNSNQQQQQNNRKTVQEPLIRPKSLGSNAQSKENIDRARELSAEAVLFRRSLDRSSMMPKRSTQQMTDRRQIFGRSASMDRNEILKRSANKDLYNRSTSAYDSPKSPVSPSAITKEDEIFQHFNKQNGPKLTSTPVKHSAANGMLSPKPSPLTPKAINNGIYVDLQEWEKLRSIKERTDREMYHKLLQQQQQQKQQQQRLATENIYERLPGSQVIVHPEPQYGSQENNNFVRGSPQRNTFSGITRNRQAKIIDGKALLAIEQAQEIQVLPINGNKWGTDQHASPTVRCQSALDGVTHGIRNSMRRGYESDTETPVILRRRNVVGSNEASPQQLQEQQQRRIGGLLTRDEILQKVKEFCRKSINRTPTMQAIYEKQPLGTDLSPVSYVSVETHQRPMSRMYASPQVPQRMQSLPQRFVPIIQETRPEIETTNSSPIYAHVIKRSSLQSNQSDFYDLPQSKQQQQQRPIYLTRGTLPLQETNNLTPVQYVILDSEKITPNQLYEYQKYSSGHINHDIYGQQQPHQIQQHHQQGPYNLRMQQLQALPTGTYGYITVRESTNGVPTTIVQHQQQQQQIMRQRLLDGRSTPLILDRSSQQASQIYWTPQHQRLQQHSGLMPVQISPRYTNNKQPSYGIIPLAKTITTTPTTTIANETMFVSGNRAIRINHHPQQYYNIPSNVIYNNNNNSNSGTLNNNKQIIINNHNNVQQVEQQQHNQQQQHLLHQQKQQQFTEKLQQQQQKNLGISTGKTIAECHAQNHYEWESGSEGSEVQRIMDNNINGQHQNEPKNDKSGELKTSSNILTNVKLTFSRLLRINQR